MPEFLRLIPLLLLLIYLLISDPSRKSVLIGAASAAVYLLGLFMDWMPWLPAPALLLLPVPKLRTLGVYLLILCWGYAPWHLFRVQDSMVYPVCMYLFLLAILLWQFFSVNWMDMKEKTVHQGRRLSFVLFLGPVLAFLYQEILHFSLLWLLGTAAAAVILWLLIPQFAKLVLFRLQARELVLQLKEEDLREVEQKRNRLQALQKEYRTSLEQVADLLEEGRQQEALDLLKKQNAAYVETREHEYNTNPALNALLNLKASECQEAGIRFDFQCVPIQDELKTIDGCLILSNLLDNAIRACRQQEHPELDLKILEKDGKIIIACSNTCVQDPGTLLHQQGFGQQIIRETISRYHGLFQTAWKNGQYYADVVLYAAGGESRQ